LKQDSAVSEQILSKLDSMNLKGIAELLSRNRAETNLNGIFGNLPNLETQSAFTGLSQEQTFLQALTYLSLCKKIVDRRHQLFDVKESGFVVDFGSGWGRITQLLSLYFNSDRILACDVMDSAIDEAKRNGVRAKYIKTEAWPPMGLQNETVDYIFSYSVFSHLSEANAWAWIQEFHRILRPGGLVFITTRHREFFDYLEALHKKTDIPSFANGAHKAFRDIKSAKEKYDQGYFCFDALGSGGKGLTPVYGEAFIPSHYVHKKYGQLFSAVGFEEPIPKGLLDQATIWLQK